MCGGHVYPNLTQNTVGMGGLVFLAFWLGLNSLPMQCAVTTLVGYGNFRPKIVFVYKH